MEELNQQVVDMERKVSLLSTARISQSKSQSDGTKKYDKDRPEDKYNILHFIFFFMSFGTIIPSAFFLTAIDFWMYKFRDTSSDTYDALHKTALQKNFLSVVGTMQSIAGIFTTILSSLFGHKINMRKRFLTTLSIVTVFFLIYTASVDVDTDSWQLGFFITILILAFFKSIAGTIFTMSNVALNSRFPPTYMQSGMYGIGSAMLFSSILQVFCLWVGGSSTAVARIYFYIGATITCLTLIVAYCSKYNSLYNYYVGDMEADTKRPLPTLAELKIVYTRMKPFIWTMLLGAFPLGMASGGVTTLIVSEYYKKGDLWTEKYYPIVTCYILPGIFSMIGRILARPILTKDNVKWWVIASLLHSYCMTPLFLFCNSPKEHLPILLPHDWQYITLHIVNSIVGGYLGTVSFLSQRKFAGDATELAFLTMPTLMILLMNALSPLNSLWVNI